ncbi:AF4/FMR2 family member 1-like [Lathamus discolor]|uniref:AF4/FMR2 family member 1-like n=1 Tax=Lathamus discolor TaxID=678569 RepID=UPI0032B77B3C
MRLYNEDRNLLRARERERRIREAQQEKNKLPEKPPIFAAPYKTHKGDDLSNRIRNVLGNYEDVMGLIISKPQWNFFGIHGVRPPVSPEDESQGSSDINLSSNTRPSSQTFPTALPSKTSVMLQKPAACVRQMDVQDQRIFRCDAQAVNEILKEMIQPWPPLLTDIPTPTAAEPSKFPLPTKESQHVGCVAQNQRQYAGPSDTLPRSQTPTSALLQEDLQVSDSEVSDSEDSDDNQVADNPLAPSSAQQSQPKTVASALSSSSESGRSSGSGSSSDSDSSSDTDSSSDSETSGSEAKEPLRASAPEADNCLTKVYTPALPTERLHEIALASRREKSKEQRIRSNSCHQNAKPRELEKKRKAVDEETSRKKVKSEKENKSLNCSPKKGSKKLKTSYEYRKQNFLPPPLPPLPPIRPAPKSTKVAQKRPRSQSELSDFDNAAKNKSDNKDPLICKRRRLESNQAELSKGIKGSAGCVTKLFPVPSLRHGTSQPKRPQLKFERHLKYPAEYYLEEAIRLKHKADAMTDKIAKAFQYLESALFLIEYGIAMESNAQKMAYKIFQDTTDFIKFIMTLKYCMSSSASSHEEIFTVLCMRCLSLLDMAMFRGKKETAAKYSSILNDHFKSFPTKAPSPSVARSTGMPSPSFPMPSPTTSQPGASTYSGNSMCSSTTVSSNILDMTYSYVNITSCGLSALNNWEQADALILKNKELFEELDAASEQLSLTSSLIRLVHYVRQSIHWLRLKSKMP